MRFGLNFFPSFLPEQKSGGQYFAECLNLCELADRLDTPAFLERIADNVARMRWLASEILERARGDHPDIDDHGLAAQLDALATTAPSLPPAWYADAAELAA